MSPVFGSQISRFFGLTPASTHGPADASGASPPPAVRRIPAADETQHGGWYGRKAARGVAHEAAQARNREKARLLDEARPVRFSDHKEHLLAAALVVALTATMGYGISDAIDSNRRISGYEAGNEGLHPCQDGYALASCIPLRRKDGRIVLQRVMMDGTLYDGEMYSRASVPVVTAEGISWSGLAYPSPGKGRIDMVFDLPPGSMVPLMSPDGTSVLVPGHGRRLDLSAMQALPSARQAVTAEGLLQDAVPGPSRPR